MSGNRPTKWHPLRLSLVISELKALVKPGADLFPHPLVCRWHRGYGDRSPPASDQIN